MKVAIIVFPGSNCDRDMLSALEFFDVTDVAMLWHSDTEIPSGVDLIILPGGFSYGDYLRVGAIASSSPIINAVKKAAERGVYILGVCNGFQILTETGLLKGALIRNKNLNFICSQVTLKVMNDDNCFTNKYKKGSLIKIPIAHHDGNFFADDKTLKMLEDNGNILFKYADSNGVVNDSTSINGSKNNIAGILSDNKRILGMMPHPERASDPDTEGGSEGNLFFKSIISFLN